MIPNSFLRIVAATCVSWLGFVGCSGDDSGEDTVADTAADDGGSGNATEGPADATEGPADATEGPADATEGPADATEGPAGECDPTQCTQACTAGIRCIAPFNEEDLPDDAIAACVAVCEEVCGDGVFKEDNQNFMNCVIAVDDQGCNGEAVSGDVTACCEAEDADFNEFCP